jgi:hypothetical protein
VTTTIARRQAKSTVFAAVLEPVRDGENRIAAVKLLAESDEGLVVRVVGKKGTGIDDVILLAFAHAADREVTLQASGQAFTFRSYRFHRASD